MTVALEDNPIDQLGRVRDKIAPTVIRFCRKRIGRTFIASELLAYVRVLHPEVAPDSPSRILRLLREAGTVSYALVSRRDSKYLVLAVAQGAA